MTLIDSDNPDFGSVNHNLLSMDFLRRSEWLTQMLIYAARKLFETKNLRKTIHAIKIERIKGSITCDIVPILSGPIFFSTYNREAACVEIKCASFSDYGSYLLTPIGVFVDHQRRLESSEDLKMCQKLRASIIKHDREVGLRLAAPVLL